jgi:ornithine decarboxylase
MSIWVGATRCPGTHKNYEAPKPRVNGAKASVASAAGQLASGSGRKGVLDLMRKRIMDEGAEEAFFVADLGVLIRQHRKWMANLPRVVSAPGPSCEPTPVEGLICCSIRQEPFYAVKCNPDMNLLATLVPLCGGFDCASAGEIITMLSLGVDPAQIIFANPCKAPSHLILARERGVDLMTFDCVPELEKVIAPLWRPSRVLVAFTPVSDWLSRLGVSLTDPRHPSPRSPRAAHPDGRQQVALSVSYFLWPCRH